MLAAAAGGPRAGGGDAPLCRRTDLAMLPLGAAVVGGGVDRRWRRVLGGGPRPRALLVCGTAADVRVRPTLRPTAVSRETGGPVVVRMCEFGATVTPAMVLGGAIVASGVRRSIVPGIRGCPRRVMRGAAAGGSLSMGGGAHSRRRTGLAMRPYGAAVVCVGVDEVWPFAQLREPLPRAEAVTATDSGALGAIGCHTMLNKVAMTFSGLDDGGGCTAEASGSRIRDEAAHSCRRTDRARRPSGAEVVWFGVGECWSVDRVGERMPRVETWLMALKGDLWAVRNFNSMRDAMTKRPILSTWNRPMRRKSEDGQESTDHWTR